MDIGRCLKDAWNLLMKDLAPLAVTAVIGAVATGVPYLIMMAVAWSSGTSGDTFTFESDGNSITTVSSDINWGAFVLLGIVAAVVGILVGAWQYSTMLQIMLRRVREGQAATMGDLRLGLEGIGAFIVAFLVLGIVIAIGFVALIIPGLILMTIWAYVLVLIADKRQGLGDAMSESAKLAKKPGYLMTFVTILVGGIVVSVVSGMLQLIPVIGQILALFVGVFMLAYVVAMYFQATGETALVDQALYGVPLPAGAAPGEGYLPAPPAPPAGGAYPPAPSAPIGGEPPAPVSFAPPPPAAPAPVPTAPAPPAAPAAPAPPAAPAAPEAPPAPEAPDVGTAPTPDADAWAAAADPLAAPQAPAPAEFEPPATSVPPPAAEGDAGDGPATT